MIENFIELITRKLDPGSTGFVICISVLGALFFITLVNVTTGIIQNWEKIQ